MRGLMAQRIDHLVSFDDRYGEAWHLSIIDYDNIFFFQCTTSTEFSCLLIFTLAYFVLRKVTIHLTLMKGHFNYAIYRRVSHQAN